MEQLIFFNFVKKIIFVFLIYKYFKKYIFIHFLKEISISGQQKKKDNIKKPYDWLTSFMTSYGANTE